MESFQDFLLQEFLQLVLSHDLPVGFTGSLVTSVLVEELGQFNTFYCFISCFSNLTYLFHHFLRQFLRPYTWLDPQSFQFCSLGL